MADFSKIEAMFDRLICALYQIFTPSEILEVRLYLDVGEYGLALETVIDIIKEEGKIISEEYSQLLDSLRSEMNIPRL